MRLRRSVTLPLAAGGAAFLAAALWWLKTVGLVILLVLLVVVLGVIIYMLWRRTQELAAAREIEHSIVRQADREIERSTAGELFENENLKQELLTAFEKLKKSAVAKRAGEEALSQLPWVLLLGPPGSGKGTLVRRSGLHFVLEDDEQSPRSVKGIGGTRGFEWWLAEEGVLLDLSGRYLKQGGLGDPDWEEFLLTLKQQRGVRALNGVIVGIAADQLADARENEIVAYAQQIRERIRELIRHLGVVFPVYIVLTRCDRIAGFAEFFEDMPEEERRAPWGATIPLRESAAQDAATIFEQEFGILLDALSKRRLRRASSLPDAVQRARAFVFPLQMERLRRPVARFLDELFQPDPVEEMAPFRGFYFATAYAGGDAIDRVLAPAAEAIGLRMEGGASPSVGQGSWFAGRLFTDVVFPDAGIVRVARHVVVDLAKQRRALVRTGLVAAAVSLLIFGLWSIPNQRLLHEAREATTGVGRLLPSTSDADLTLQDLGDLDRLRVVLDRLDRQRGLGKRPWLPPLYATAGGLRKPLEPWYAARCSDVMLGLAAEHMRSDLSEMIRMEPGAFAATYHRYRAWNLLTQDRNSLVPADAPVLVVQVDSALAVSRRNATGDGAAGQFSDRVRRQVSFLVRHPDAFREVRGELDGRLRPSLSLEDSAAAWLARRWDTGALYRDAIAEIARATPDSTGQQILGAPVLLAADFVIRGPYLRSSWEQYVRPRAEWYERQMELDNRLGTACQDVRGAIPAVRSEFLRAYAEEYSHEWLTALTRTTLAPRSGLSEVGSAKLAVPEARRDDGQLMVLLHRTRAATQLGEPAGSPMDLVQSRFAAVEGFFHGALQQTRKGFWSNAWGRIRGLTPFRNRARASNETPFLDQYRKILDQMSKALANLDEGKREEFRSNRNEAAIAFNTTVTAPLISRYRDTAALQPMLALLTAPLGVNAPPLSPSEAPGPRAAGVDLLSDQIIQDMRADLGPAFAPLRNAYPFSRGSPVDADPAAFTAFFGPGGAFDKFYQSTLKSYLAEDGSPAPGATETLAPSIVRCVKSAHAIRRAMFSAGSPGFSFTAEPEQPVFAEGTTVNVNWLDLAVGGENFHYGDLGVTQPHAMQWPGTDPSKGANLTVHNFPGTGRPQRWGLFRVLDDARRETMGDAVAARWRMRSGSQAVDITWRFRVQGPNPFARGFFDFNLP